MIIGFDASGIMKKIKIIYDENCSLCKWIGGLARKKAGVNLELIYWAELALMPEYKHYLADINRENLESIAAIDAEGIHWGDDAWALLLEHYPVLSSLNWLADKIGLRSSFVKVSKSSAHAARFLCSNCGYFKNKANRNL